MVWVMSLVLVLQILNLAVGVMNLRFKSTQRAAAFKEAGGADDKKAAGGDRSIKALESRQQKLYTLLENIDRYDGTGKGQIKI
nr:MAG TPA: hypothetical protein [Caudoviricetes sp.]